MPSQMPPRDAEGILYLIDLSGYVFRAYHAIAPLSNSKGEPTHAVLGTVNMLQKVVNDRKPHMLAVCADSRTISFRKEMDPRYKANRPPAPPDLSQQMARCYEIVRAYNIPVHQQDGLEADDFIAAVTARALKENLRVVIVSSDKDLMQLVHDDDDRVLLWDSMRDRVYGAEEVKAKFGVMPSKLRDLLALTGDTSDNIPGVPSIGPKSASDLLNEFGTIEGIYANLDKVKRPKWREVLKEHEADARMSQALVTLKSDAVIEWDLEHAKYGGANNDELWRLFKELEFTRLLDQVKPPDGSSVRPSEAPGAQAEVKLNRVYIAITDRAALDALMERAKKTKTLAVKLRTTSHDASRAEIIGVSLSVQPGEGFYVPLSHRYLGVPKQLAWQEVRDALLPVMNDKNVTKLGHQLKFDEIVLDRNGVSLDGPIFDTLLASYLLDSEAPSSLKELARREFDVAMAIFEEAATPKSRGTHVAFDEIEVERAAEFAASEAEICISLAKRFGPRIEKDGLDKLMRDVELPLSRVLAQMEATGVLVDTAKLAELSTRVEHDLKSLEAKAKEIAGREFSVRSRDQLEKILFDELKLPVLKRTPKGGRSTDAAVLEELAESHALPQVVCDFRELDKLKGTYLDALPKAVNSRTGRVHTTFHQTVAATGRLSSMDPNLQNIPIRTDVGKEIRAAFIAPPGSQIVSADYSQIELRVLAHLSHDEQLIDAFKTNEDVHTRTASLIFNVAKQDVTSEMRRRAKTINFGVIYGMGESALAKQTGVTREEAARFIEAYFTRYEGVARFMEKTVENARHGEAVRTILGRRRFLPNLHSANRGLRFEAERIAKNTPIQGTAADLIKIAMVQLGSGDVVPGARMILTVHDELVFEVPADKVKDASAKIRDAMEGAMKLDVPLQVDVGSGANWALAH
jgi:DNA polymerase-1